MIYFNGDECITLSHAAEVMGGRIAVEPDEYTSTDTAAVEKLNKAADTGHVLVITGAEMSWQDASAFYQQVVAAELDNWVPDASQRLIRRAGRVLGMVSAALSEQIEPDHGPAVSSHPVVGDYEAGVRILRCVTCHRMFRA